MDDTQTPQLSLDAIATNMAEPGVAPVPDDLWEDPKKTLTLPYWCSVFAWLLILLSVAASAFFVILYSFEWGPDVTNPWLLAFSLSFLESVVFIQPIKVCCYM